jgi:hypothetical protein
MPVEHLPHPLLPFNIWIQDTLPSIPVEKRPMACKQEAGELLVLPKVRARR